MRNNQSNQNRVSTQTVVAPPSREFSIRTNDPTDINIALKKIRDALATVSVSVTTTITQEQARLLTPLRTTTGATAPPPSVSYPITIDKGGTGNVTAQAAINALTAVAAAINEYVLTKDTATQNAVWKVATGGGGGNNPMALAMGWMA